MKPNDPAATDTDALRAWIGRRESGADVITPRLESSLPAVFDRPPGRPPKRAIRRRRPSTGALRRPSRRCRASAPTAIRPRVGFMPPVPLPRRMWAVGARTLLEPLRVGDIGTKDSTIENVSVKTGRSGTLCFVTVSHRVSSARGPALEERQDIVYRDAPHNDAASPAPVRPAVAGWQRTIPCDPVLLFRYSL